MNLRQAIGLTAMAAAFSFPAQIKAGQCGLTLQTAPNCYFSTDVAYLYYGTLTLLNPDGSFNSSTNIVTAETGIVPFDTTPPGVPADFLALFPGIVGQMEADPQSTFAAFPTWLFTGLAALEDGNGFGFVPDPNALLNTPPDPAVVSFDQQLASVAGPYTTVSDTGFQTQPANPAYCDYLNSIFFPGFCTAAVPDQYVFTYEVGPDNDVDGNIYTSDVNFQIYSRNVTEQLTSTPEPATLLPLALGLLVLLRRRIPPHP